MNRQISYFYCCFLFFTAIFLFQSNLVAQSVTKSYHLPEFEILQFEHHDRQIKLLTFDRSITLNEYTSLPVFWDQIEVNHLYTSYRYTLSNEKYQLLTSEEVSLIPSEYSFAEPKVHIHTSTDKNKFYASLYILPVIKNASGQYQRLVSCNIEFEGINPVLISKRGGLSNSVLEKGSWYKIAANSSGLYKVTYNDLKDMGVAMSGLRSNSIALFGNGGGMLPDENLVVQIDDLLECPIMVIDNGAGVFDENSYFVFYAQGPHTWEYSGGRFTHKYNIYSDNAYYFINVDDGIGEKKRIETKNFQNQTENGMITSFIHYDFFEKDVVNFGESGREWFDEALYANQTKTYQFTLPELYDNAVRIKMRAASTSTASSNIEVSWNNGNTVFGLSGVSGSSYAVVSVKDEELKPFPSGNISLTLKYNSSQSSAAAHLDYIEIQAKCSLNITNSAMPFAITENIGAGNLSLVRLENASSQTMIWDVTEHNAVYALQGNLSGNRFSFKTPTDEQRNFVAFNGTAYNSVTKVGKVTNQNLHGLKDVDMVIVSHPDFLMEANRLAKFRTEQEGLKVAVVTPEQVYNEFSSGAQDPMAIRNFMRYLYDNDGQTIKYLLLFGRPSYDYRGRVTGTRMFVPNYQVDTRLYEDAFRSGDDFFGVLGIAGSSLINVAVGRFPVSTLAQAKIVVDKTINASAKYKIPIQNASQVSNFGNWRNVMTFVADDRESEAGAVHARTADSSATEVEREYPAFNLDKIYCDMLPAVSYAGGKRYPDANKAINMRMERGTLVIAYFGHGGGNGWSHERILEISDINSWKNKYNQPLMITLTCSFAWYDKPALSPAEFIFLSENGGASSLITTSRVSYSNESLGKAIFDEIGRKANGRYQTVGEIHRLAKNRNGGITNNNTTMIYLMGDPAMRINVPNKNVRTDEILGEDLQKLDTLKALTKVTVKGRVTDDAGKTLTGFTGNIYPSIFDKAITQTIPGESYNVVFNLQKSVVFKGNATVTDGHFEFSFIVPKDINFEYGKGKISYYAASENDDAGDYYNDFIIGGISDKPIIDDKGPEIGIFLNDEKFVSGGITNPDPVLILKLKDENGINTTGNGIGHDLVAILDDNIEKQIILNDYYLADQDSYNSGTVRYPLQNLSPGAHTLKVRAWDICNNPSEATIDFIVKSDNKLELANVLNYPNPFTTKTSFYFEHNQPMETFDVLIHIFTISGKLVKTINVPNLFLEGTNNHKVLNLFAWDGRDEYGDKIGKGVYLYRLTVRNSQGKTAEKIEKIAIL